MECIKCISVWQPWAQLIVAGFKRFETRGRKSNYSGPLFIHAAKKDPAAGLRMIFKALPDDKLPKEVASEIFTWASSSFLLRTGGIVGMVWMNRSDPVEAVIPQAYEQERCLGDFSPGRWLWSIEQKSPAPLVLYRAIPLRGRQGLFNVWNNDETRCGMSALEVGVLEQYFEKAKEWKGFYGEEVR